MKFLISLLILGLIGCTNKQEDSHKTFSYQAGSGSLQGTANLGDVAHDYNTIFSLKILNQGTSNLIGPATLNNSNFNIVYSSGCATVAPGKSCLLKVSFNAKNHNPGLIQSGLTLDNFFVNLQANILPAPEVNVQTSIIFTLNDVETSSVDFGTITNTQSIIKTIVVKNNGNQKVLGQMSVTNNFAIVYDSCSQVELRPQNNCFIKISFTGSGKDGSYNESLSFLTKTVAIQGIVVPAVQSNPQISNITVLYQNQSVPEIIDNTTSTKQYIINFKNTGSGPVLPLNLNLNNNNFNLVFNQCNKILNPGSSCQLRLMFSTAGKTLGQSYSSLILGNNISFPITVNMGASQQTACSLADAQANGFNITKALSALGNKINTNVASCSINCIGGYILDSNLKKCVVQLDPDNDGVVDETAFNLLLDDAQSGYISNVIELPEKIFEFSDQISLPHNITIQALNPTNKPTFRKKNELIAGIDKVAAQNIKNLILANLPLVNFNVDGDVTGYNGVATTVGLQNAKNAILTYLENNNLLDPVVVTYGAKKLRMDIEGYATRCKNATGESYICPSAIPLGTTKFTPFYQEILNTNNLHFSQYNKNTTNPVFYINSNNVLLKNIKIECPSDVPYFPVHEMVNISPSKPNGEVDVVGGVRLSSGFAGNGIYLYRATNSNIDGVEIKNCSLGIYSINSNNIKIENNTILTNVKKTSINPLANKEIGDFGVQWKNRFHGINSIRIHGTEDRNFVIKNNIIGDLVEGGSQKGIHIHGTSLSGRDLDGDFVADSPDQGFLTNDEGLTSLALYGDRSIEARVLRKNFKVLNNTLIGHHISAIDFEGDQLNVDIRLNTIQQTKDLFYVSTSVTSQDGGIGIRILSETSPLNIFNLFGAGTNYNLDFVGYAKNLRIESNTIEDGFMGIALYNNQNDLALDYDNFPTNPLSPINTNYNCEAGTAPVTNPRCSSQISIINNAISRMASNPNAAHQQLQSYCLFMTNTVGAEVIANNFNTCNLPIVNYLGSPSAILVVNSRKVFFIANTISVDAATTTARQSLTLNTTSGWNRYYGIRTQGRAASVAPPRAASHSVFSRILDTEFNIQGYATAPLTQTALKLNIFGARLTDLQRLTPESATNGQLFLNEGLADQPNEYKFNNNSELNNLLE